MAGPTATDTATTTTPVRDVSETEQPPASAPAESGTSFPRCKSPYFSWRVAGAVLAFLVVLGWIFIIVMLILEEKWQLVLVAWLLLYSAAHFCYWYCKRHSLLSLHRQVRLRVLAHSRNPENGEKSEDGPPSYDEVMKTEAPPPAYFTVVSENVKYPAGISPCVPSEAPSEFSPLPSSEEKQPQEASPSTKNKRSLLTLEIRECPPAYQSPKSPRALSPRILPGTHGTGVSLVTATAAASAAATATAAFSYFPPPVDAEEETTEDPIRNPIVQHLRSTTMPTLEVSSNVDVSVGGDQEANDVTRDVRDSQIECEVVDMQRSSIL